MNKDYLLQTCEGADAKIKIRYEVTHNSEYLVSIFKITDYVNCGDGHDQTEFDPLVLYISNGNLYKVSLNVAPDLKNYWVTSYSGLNKSPDTKECNCTNEYTGIYMLLRDRETKLFLLKDSTFCFAERNLFLQDGFKFDLINQ